MEKEIFLSALNFYFDSATIFISCESEAATTTDTNRKTLAKASANVANFAKAPLFSSNKSQQVPSSLFHPKHNFLFRIN